MGPEDAKSPALRFKVKIVRSDVRGYAAGQALAPRQIPASVAQDPGTAWLVWLFGRIQLEEAESLINPQAASNEQNFQPQPH
jgi:hypothetical protein